MADDMQLTYSMPQWLIEQQLLRSVVPNRGTTPTLVPKVDPNDTLVPVLRVDAQRHAAAQVADSAQLTGVVGVDRPPTFSLGDIVPLVFSIVILGLVIRLIGRMGSQ